MQSSFSNHVKNLGLKRGIEGSKAKHTRIKDYYAKVNEPTPQIRQVEKPKAGIFETTSHYGDKVVNSVLEQIKPQWESMAELTKEVRTARKEALEARKTLLELQDRVKPYLDAIRPLRSSERIKLQEVMKATSLELQENAKQTEKQRKEQRQESQAARWEKVYVGLTSDQQIKTEFFLKIIKERYKNDPAMLNLKLDAAKNKIAENPAALDKVELPQIKQHQDIEVKISKNNSPQKQR